LRKQPNIKLLVFPVEMDASAPFIATAKALGINTTGASSIANPGSDTMLDELIQLPFISDDCFNSAFIHCIESYDITHVYTPHPGVWTVLNRLLQQHPIFTLCSPSPYQSIWHDSRTGYEWAKSILSDHFPDMLNSTGARRKRALKAGEYASLYMQFLRIPGQSDINKLTAFAHLARVLPQGDLVEIGSFCGRSAFALAWLGERHKIGNLISIDPWSNHAIEEQGQQAEILNNDIERIDFEKIYRIYISNISLLNNAGYIREVSLEAKDLYNRAASEGLLNSPQLGTIGVEGRISLLHIDGNHEYHHVRQDIDTWSPSVISGGWILLDDYVWPFGDGPQRAGDELLASHGFDQAFAIGDTLYLRKP
jgi:hypothetical protein